MQSRWSLAGVRCFHQRLVWEVAALCGAMLVTGCTTEDDGEVKRSRRSAAAKGTAAKTNPENGDDAKTRGEVPRGGGVARNQDVPNAGGKKHEIRGVHKPVRWTFRETALLTAAQARAVAPGSFRLSPDGRRWACAVRKYGGWTVVVDGVDEPFTCKEVSALQFSSDGKQYAYVAGQNEINLRSSRVVWNGKEIPGNDAVLGMGLGNIASARRGYGIGTGAPDNAKVFINGAKIAERAVSDPGTVCAFSTRGAGFRWGMVVDDGVLVDGKLVYRSARQTVHNLQFSDDGSSHAFLVTEGTGQQSETFAVINGNAQKRFPSIRDLTLSANGKTWAFLAQVEGGKTYLVSSNQKPAAVAVAPPTGYPVPRVLYLSPDGKRRALVQQSSVDVDGRPEPLVNNDKLSTWLHRHPVFSPDSRHYAYCVGERREGEVRYRVTRDGKPQRPWAALSPGVVWSPDSASLAYVARDKAAGGWLVVRDDVEQPPCEALAKYAAGGEAMTFSPDARHLAAVGMRDLAWHVLIDGEAVVSYDKILADATWFGFTPQGSFTCLARKTDGSVCHVELTPPGTKPGAAPQKLQAPLQADGWVALFNGKDLHRWEPNEWGLSKRWEITQPAKPEWAVHDGAIEGLKYKFPALATAGRDFRDFHLSLECRTNSTGAGFVAFRCGKVLLSNYRLVRRTGSYSAAPFYGVDVDVKDKLAADDEWVRLEVLVEKKRVMVRVNGKVTVDRPTTNAAAESGPIVLSQESSSGTLSFRKITIRNGVDPAEWRKGKP